MAILRRLGAGLAAALIAAAAGVVTASGEQRTATAEDEIKAAFLLNFSRFVEWPPAATAAGFHICTIAEPAFDAALARIIEGETTGGRPILRATPESPDDARSCDILFLSRQENARAERWIAALRGQPVLIVGESKAAADAGAAITFVLEDNRVKFDINERAAGAGLRISSKLLRVARRVTPRETQ